MRHIFAQTNRQRYACSHRQEKRPLNMQAQADLQARAEAASDADSTRRHMVRRVPLRADNSEATPAQAPPQQHQRGLPPGPVGLACPGGLPGIGSSLAWQGRWHMQRYRDTGEVGDFDATGLRA